MKVSIRQIVFFTLITMVVSLGTAVQAQNRAYQVSDRQIQSLLDRIETRTDTFKSEIDRSLDRSNIDGTNREDSINAMISNFEQATDRLKENFNSRRSSSNDVQQVLNQAIRVNAFMQNNRMSPTAENQWNLIRTDLNTLAGYYRVTSNWNYTVNQPQTQTGYYVSDAQLRALLNRLNTRNNTFRMSFDRWWRLNQRYQRDNDVSQSATELQQALQNLNRNYNDRNSGYQNLSGVLRPSASINSFVVTNRTNRDVVNRWNLVRSDLNTLASYYRVSWDWNNPVYPGDGNWSGNWGGNFDSRLTGTYRLNTSQSDNVANIVGRAIINANYNSNQRDRVRQNLERRLASPVTLTLEKRGQQVTMSSSNAASVSLDADGVRRTETSPNGRTVSVTVAATNSELTINYEGDRMNDYYVTFAPINNNQLRVTRRIYLENQDQTVTVTSIYDKTSREPQWNTAVYPTVVNTGPVGGYAIANNTTMTATLDTTLSTRSINERQRFSMTVTSPSQYYGAVIQGNVDGERSGALTGRANLAINFETIRMPNGQTYRFAGIIEQVREPNGNNVNVDNEGLVRDTSQTTRTVQRAGIGAVLGAIIGAIVDGGSGAAIGAGVGAGAGAGTVILQGRDNLELPSGSQFTITAMSPAYVGAP